MAEEIYQRVGMAIRNRRLVAGWTQAELAGALGISRAALANIEAGRQRVNLHRLEEMAVTFDCPLYELLGIVSPSEKIMMKKLRAENMRNREGRLRLIKTMGDLSRMATVVARECK